MRRLSFLLLLLCGACATRAPDHPVPASARPGEPVVVFAQNLPDEITGLLTSTEADSCGVCVREKRAEAFALAEIWFAPGNRVRADGAGGWRVLPGGDHELYFGEPSPTPRLSFRIHTIEDHLVGIAAEDYTSKELADAILSRLPESAGTEVLEVVEFAYGDGPTFLFDEKKNRIQVQCRILGRESRPYGGTLRE